MKTRLSSSCAAVGQGLVLAFFIPFNVFVWFELIQLALTPASLAVATCVSVFSIVVIWLAFNTADISIEKGSLIITRLFRTSRIPIKQYKKIGSIPLGYYVEFEDGRRTYVLFGPSELVRQFIASQENQIINEIKLLMDQERGT